MMQQRMLRSSARGRRLRQRQEPLFGASLRDVPFIQPFLEELSESLDAMKMDRLSLPKEAPRLQLLETSINVLETDQGFAIEAEMPGLRKEDISVKVLDGDQLVIRGEKRFERTTGNLNDNTNVKESGEAKEGENADATERYLTFERTYGTFERTFTLPENVDTSKIKASYTDGVLRVDVPKTTKEAPSKSWSVEIQ